MNKFFIELAVCLMLALIVTPLNTPTGDCFDTTTLNADTADSGYELGYDIAVP